MLLLKRWIVSEIDSLHHSLKHSKSFSNQFAARLCFKTHIDEIVACSNTAITEGKRATVGLGHCTLH